MKRRLLFLFAVFMVATSVGWGQTDCMSALRVLMVTEVV